MEEPITSKCTPKSELKILSQETSVEMGYYRIQAGNRIHHLTINCDVYDESTMSRPYLLIPSLPEFPDTAWTTMHVSRGLYGSPISTISYEPLPSIELKWHPEYINVLSLRRIKRYTANVHEVLFNGHSAISKIACWEWEIPRLENETYVYKILSEHKDPNEPPITPAFLGHVTDGGDLQHGSIFQCRTTSWAYIIYIVWSSRIFESFHDLWGKVDMVRSRAEGMIISIPCSIAHAITLFCAFIFYMPFRLTVEMADWN